MILFLFAILNFIFAQAIPNLPITLGEADVFTTHVAPSPQMEWVDAGLAHTMVPNSYTNVKNCLAVSNI